jgi:hypothetical protein
MMEKEKSIWQTISSKLIYYLRTMGYTAASVNISGKENNWDTEKICVTKEGKDICDINCIEGTITYHKASDQEEIELIRELINNLQEQEKIFTRAEPMQVEGLSHYKGLAEYNNVILAACESRSMDSFMQKVNCYQYVTWEKDNGGSGVHTGNYFGDNYTDVKENFAVRSGIVRKDKLFSETEMMAIFSSLVKLEDIDDTITNKNYKLFEQIKSKIRNIVPDIEEKIYGKNPRYEESEDRIVHNSYNASADDTSENDQELYEHEILQE